MFGSQPVISVNETNVRAVNCEPNPTLALMRDDTGNNTPLNTRYNTRIYSQEEQALNKFNAVNGQRNKNVGPIVAAFGER